MVIGNRLVCSVRAEERSIKPGVNRRGLSETLEVGLRKPPVRRQVLVEPPSPFPPSLFLIHFSGGFSSILFKHSRESN